MALIGARSGAMGLREDDHLVFRRIRIGHEWVDIDVVTRPGQGISGHMWETEEPYVTNDYGSDPYAVLSLQDRYPLRKLVGVPMIDSSGRLVGTLEVHDPVVERDFGQMDVEALQLLAHQATIALENSRLNQLKDEFLSIVSHELKTPVTTIKGFTQVLQRRLSPESLERCGHYLDTLNHQADRLTGLINDLLDLSRIQQGRFTFEKSRFDYGRLIHDVVAEMQLVTTRNPIVLTGPDHVQAVGNPDRLRQVLVNLIDNAAKHGPPDSAIRITVEQKEHEVETFVCDDGDGLPQGEAERIFGPYYQVRQGGKQQAKGLGLGLYVSRQIVEEHGGRIWLDTTDHTSFCFTVPIPG
jgi:signal transduction histidine kinase